MPIAKIQVRGMPPLDKPVAGLAIEQRLREAEVQRSREHAEQRSPTPAQFAASDAYACERKIAFGRLGVPKDIQYDAAALMTFRAGDFYHQIAQEALVQWLDCRCEVDFDWRPQFSLYGRCDGVYDLPAGPGDIPVEKVVVEIKSQSGYGFDLATGAKRSAEGPGPKIDHLIQGGLAAMAPSINAQHVHIVYLNKDRGVVAEWIIGLDDELPHLTGATIRELVDGELERLAAVGELIQAGDLPGRDIPGYGTVEGEPPAAGSRDNPWNCRYCSWQPTCADLTANVEPGWVAAFLATKEGAA